ncbi:MAG: hypothetical protein RBU25_06285 [Lentisphaeria bacterium]|jgi:hypothetical protein|nr:hypothetical protein [Lentisphaeria bacterium]
MARDNFTGKGKYARLAAALNELGGWVNRFRAAPPLLLRSQPGGGVALGINTPAMAGAILGFMQHPFQLTVAEGNYQIRGGSVHTGTGIISASGHSGGYSGGTRQFWLTITYPNEGTATAVIGSGGTVPASDYAADPMPVGCDETPVYAGWAKIVVPLAAVAAGNVSQYQYSDLYVPRGKTVLATRVVGHEWVDNELQAAVIQETYVNGVLAAVSGTNCLTLFATGECPEEEE